MKYKKQKIALTKSTRCDKLVVHTMESMRISRPTISGEKVAVEVWPGLKS